MMLCRTQHDKGHRRFSSGRAVVQRHLKLFYESDTSVPADEKTVPTFSQEELNKDTVGYQYLGAAQATLNHKIMKNLPDAYIRAGMICIWLWLIGCMGRNFICSERTK